MIKKLGPNETEITVKKGVILVSYETPVAFVDNHGNAFEIGRDELFKPGGKKIRSKTTSKHINAWLNNQLVKTRTETTKKFFEQLV